MKIVRAVNAPIKGIMMCVTRIVVICEVEVERKINNFV